MPDYSKKIVYLSQAQYQELVTEGTITVDGVTVTYDENDIYVTPQAEPVTDVRVNGTSITANGVANIPYGAYNVPGVVSTQGTYGTTIYENHKLGLTQSVHGDYKEGYRPYCAVTIGMQHEGTFYGLAKASGDTSQASSSNAVGTYTDAAKASIQQMLGVSDLLAPRETSYIASQAYAVGDISPLMANSTRLQLQLRNLARLSCRMMAKLLVGQMRYSASWEKRRLRT